MVGALGNLEKKYRSHHVPQSPHPFAPLQSHRDRLRVPRVTCSSRRATTGLRASYRNLFFDKYGHLLERKALASAHGRGRAERGATHETPLPDTRAWHRMKAKEMLGERDVQVTRGGRSGESGAFLMSTKSPQIRRIYSRFSWVEEVVEQEDL